MDSPLTSLGLRHPVLAAPMAVVSFTFGLPGPSVFRAFRRAGTLTAQTVTSVAETRLPLVAAGGLSTPAEVACVIGAGAAAVMVGTALLRSDESGASAVHRAAIARPGGRPTVLTRAFTGRPARGLLNTFIEKYDPVAPLGYPAVHHLTSPLRKAAAAAANPELVNLWAGTGYQHSADGPAGTILIRLASEV